MDARDLAGLLDEGFLRPSLEVSEPEPVDKPRLKISGGFSETVDNLTTSRTEYSGFVPEVNDGE